MAEKNPAYVSVMEQAGFYVNGKPIPTVIEIESLDDSESLERHVRYGALLHDKAARTISVFELSGSPCVYFSQLENAHPAAAELSQLRRSAWNRGGAPLLWVITPAKVLIYNCYARPSDDDQTDADQNLLRLFEQTAAGLKELNDFAGRAEIETGRFWQRDEAKKINREHRVDASLLKDLADAEVALTQKRLPASLAHALLGRSIFIAYLQDRGILNSHFFHSNYNVENLAELLGSKTKTYKLFRWIRRTFNGDLFPLNRKKKSRHTGETRTIREEDRVKPEHLKIIQLLMKGTQIASGQGRLWPYDFSIIPVELISSIYESFAYSGDSKAARARSTHYTPYPLVDLVLAQVLPNVSPNAKALDMACGSGVFLVECFRRLVMKHVLAGEELTRKLIRQTLHEQVFGIDISKDAIQIAAFSLYLTALELDPKPQPPSALKFKNLIGHNLFAADTFDLNATFNSIEPFVSRSFGVVVGNPPWKSGKKKDHKLLLEYCENHNYPLARNTPDQAFLWRITDWAADDAMIGIVLHGKPFFAQTELARDAKKQLFSRFRPRVIINLADLRTEKIFPHSVAPALIFIGDASRPSEDDTFILAAPKKTTGIKKHGIIELGPEDIKTLRVIDLVSDPDILKAASWGTARDFALIRRLRNSYMSLQEFVEEHHCTPGQGFQKAGGTKDASHMYNKHYLPPKTLTPFEINVSSLPLFQEQGLHRPRNVEIYHAPLIITTRGLPTEGFAASFAGDDVLYSESYYGISFPKDKVELAHFLNALLNTAVVNYFLFLTATVWGVERDEVRAEDVLRIPIPPYDATSFSRIVSLEAELRASTDAATIEGLRVDLNNAVADLYELDDAERMLINDMIKVTIDLKVKRYKSKALLGPTPPQLQTYLEQVISVIQPFLNSLDGHTISAAALDVGNAPVRVVKFTSQGAESGDAIKAERIPAQELEAVLGNIASQLPAKLAHQVYGQRVLRVYSGEVLYVVKPSEYRFWTPSAALSDADAILAEHQENDDESNYVDAFAASGPPRAVQAVHSP
jgi:type I restriction-modification system DNA methylase subunit